MGSLQVTVRPAERTDVSVTADVMARAFEHDPVCAHILRRAESRRKRLRRYFMTMLRREAVPLGTTDVALVDGRIVGAAIWKPPGLWLPPMSVQLTTLPAYLAAYRRDFGRAVKVESALVKEHPQDEPHWYLQGLGAEPELRGRGIGAALLGFRLARADEAGQAAYLESSNPANVSLYLRFGFEITGLLGWPQDAPRVTKMWRPAARQSWETPPDRDEGRD
jgi:ribosomal protein S18 acetylase RimI-like enzyme